MRKVGRGARREERGGALGAGCCGAAPQAPGTSTGGGPTGSITVFVFQSVCFFPFCLMFTSSIAL